MITRTFLSKSNTILKDSYENYGLHPICMLNYGHSISRVLLYFDLSTVKSLVSDDTYAIDKLTHKLKMTNCASIDLRKMGYNISSMDDKLIKERAVSFYIFAFKIPKPWDEGVGFDSSMDFFLSGKGVTSIDGSNWYNSDKYTKWDNEGIYTTDQLESELEKFDNNKSSIIIATQHFDHGNEDLELDLTNYITKIINGEEKNYGICLAFAPKYENETTDYSQYIGFFNDHTNTVFHPVIETRCSERIIDNRYNFHLNKTNRLYLYTKINGELCNLDEMPICKVDDIAFEVKKQSKGVYYAVIKLSNKDYSSDEILSDVWSNLIYKGDTIDDVEMEFVTMPSTDYFSFNDETELPANILPTIVGINDSEEIERGEKRMIKVLFKKPYTYNDYKIIDNAYYKIYIKDGERYVDIIDWDVINQNKKTNTFVIDSNDLIPNTYYVDIKIKNGSETRIFKNELKFKVLSNTTHIKK